ncbi:protein tyrosine kinase domain containing protein, partial [Entamoeba invadens IP1]|uniref:protein tyrosine kinase domain containing protein n=1 Tax=Entamoeba invadens IP1 TaxID=370355 RepID=UPI0002C3E206
MIFLLLATSVVAFNCSKGCSSGCIADYACSSKCSSSYDDDNSCLSCKGVYTIYTDETIYLPRNDECVPKNNVIDKNNWLPPDDKIEEIFLSTPVSFTFDESSDVDYSFCTYNPRYRIGKWFRLDMSTITDPYIWIKMDKDIGVDVSIDISHSQKGSKYGICTAHTNSPVSKLTCSMKGPVINPRDSITNKVIVNFDYFFFVSMSEERTTHLNLTVEKSADKIWDISYEIKQDDIDYLSQHLGTYRELQMPMENFGVFHFPVCMPTFLLKMVVFTINFNGNYSLLISTKKSNRMNFLEEFGVINNGGKVSTECIGLWNGARNGVLTETDRQGIEVKLSGSNKTRYFTLITPNFFSDLDVQYQVICPNNCNQDTHKGACNTNEARCMCIDGYGGDDCHQLCYYNNAWTVKDYSGLCKYGTENCDSNCGCVNGTTLSNDNLCVTP